jgi:hypothetical protein
VFGYRLPLAQRFYRRAMAANQSWPNRAGVLDGARHETDARAWRAEEDF